MPGTLAALVAFVAEHQRCGDLDGGLDQGHAWMACSLGRGKRGEDSAVGQAGKLPLLFIHSRTMSNPEMNVL